MIAMPAWLVGPGMPGVIGKDGPLWDYVVAPDTGDDGNPGTPWRPWASWAPLNALGTVRNGVRIGVVLRSGGASLRSQLSIIGSNITVEGIGGQFYVDCREPLLAADWEPYTAGGRTKAYRTINAVALPNDVSTVGNGWDDENFMVQMASAPVDANLGFVFAESGWTGASTKLIVVLADGSDPRVNGRTIRYARRSWAININGSGNTVRSIKARGNAHAGGMIYLPGDRQLVLSCRMEDCGRHALLMGGNSAHRKNVYYGGRNDLEGAVGFVVWNKPDIRADACYSSDNIFDARSMPNVSAELAHDDTSGHLAASYQGDDNTFMNGCGGAHGAEAAATVSNNPILINAGTAIGKSNAASVITVNNPSGNIAGTARLLLASAGGSISITNNVPGRQVTVAQVGDGVLSGTSTTEDLNLSLTGVAGARLKIHVLGFGGSNFKFIKGQRGALARNYLEVTPVLSNPSVTHIEWGIGGLTGTITGDNNILHYGSDIILNGVTRKTLPAWQAASGQDANSAYGSRTTVHSDDFTGSNGNLDARTNWSKKSGNSAAVQVQSSAVRSQNVGFGTFAMPSLGSANMWAEIVIKTTTPPNIIPALRVQDSSNYCGGSITATQFFLQRWVAGVFGQPGASTGFTPAVNDEVCVSLSGDIGALYVNKARAVGPLNMGVSALTGQQAGLTGGSGASDPMLDNFACGTV